MPGVPQRVCFAKAAVGGGPPQVGAGLPEGRVGDFPPPGAIGSADDELRFALVDVLQQRGVRAILVKKAEDIM